MKATHGGMFQAGFPDLWANHPVYGARWIEVKLPDMKGSRYTAAQLETFPQICKGFGVWVLTSASESELAKLRRRPNWHRYLDVFK